MRKNIFSVFAALLILVGMAACAFDNKSDEPSPSTQTSAEETEADVTSSDVSADDTAEPEDDGAFYNDTKVVEAYKSGDVSSLDEKELAIYNGAVAAIYEFISDGMTDEEKVIVAHDWVTTHTTYDEGMLELVPQKSPDTENPYGVLINHQGICKGYTSTYQLFMDMLGIESVIVSGMADGEEHAWNVVNLDGKWYHVDTTWDDFVPDEEDRPAFHTYLLVPDGVMESRHVWDRVHSPTADSYDRMYLVTHGRYCETADDVNALLDAAYVAGERYCEVIAPSSDILGSDHVEYYWHSHESESCTVTIYWLL